MRAPAFGAGGGESEAAMSDDLAQVTILVSGSVQGVFFRASVLEQAQALSLTGWVKNLPDGGVEIVAEGSRLALQDLVEWAKHGPPAADVEDVGVRWRPYEGAFRTFMIVR